VSNGRTTSLVSEQEELAITNGAVGESDREAMAHFLTMWEVMNPANAKRLLFCSTFYLDFCLKIKRSVTRYVQSAKDSTSKPNFNESRNRTE
jgi:hypothetical protein